VQIADNSQVIPNAVARGDLVTFRISVVNRGCAGVTLSAGSTLHLGNSGTDASLNQDVYVPPDGSPVTLSFGPVHIDAPVGSYTTILSLYGIDDNGLPYNTELLDGIVQVFNPPRLQAEPTALPPIPNNDVVMEVRIWNAGESDGYFYRVNDQINLSFPPEDGWGAFSNFSSLVIPVTTTQIWNYRHVPGSTSVAWVLDASAPNPYVWKPSDGWSTYSLFVFNTRTPIAPGTYMFSVYATLEHGYRQFRQNFTYTISSTPPSTPTNSRIIIDIQPTGAFVHVTPSGLSPPTNQRFDHRPPSQRVRAF
jgi:hypothetical protein